MMANLSGVEFLKTLSKYRKRSGESLSCINVLDKARQGNVQKSDARAKLLFIFTIRFMVLQVCLSVSPFVNSLCYL